MNYKFLSNISKGKEDQLRKLLDDYGINYKVDEDAKDIYGNKIENCVSIWIDERASLQRLFKLLEEEGFKD